MFPGNRESMRGGRPPSTGIPGQRSKPPAPPAAEEPPQREPDGDEISPNPTAVGYRSEAETCGHCSYMQGDMCVHPMIAKQVGPGDSCAAFEAKASDNSGVADFDAGGMDLEGETE